MAETCLRVREGKTFIANVSCEDDSCCFLDRIFTYTESVNTTLVCQEAWSRCLSNTSAVSSAGLSELERIWLAVICVLIFIALLVSAYFIYRLVRLKHYQKKQKDASTEPDNIIKVEAIGEEHPKLMEAAQIFVTNAAMRPSTREKSPVNLKDKLKQLILAKDEEKLSAFLETMSDYYAGQIDADTLQHAKGVLLAWQCETRLENFCSKSELQDGEVLNLQRTLQIVEESPFKCRVHPLIVKHAKQRLDSELDKQIMINDLKAQVTEAMQSNDLEKLENLVDIIRAKQLDKEFEKELWYAQNQFEEHSKSGKVLMERDLSSAIGRRDAGVLRRAIQRVEISEYSSELGSELAAAKKAMEQLEEIEKFKNLHRLKIRNAIKSAEISRMELALKNVKMDGFGEDLKIEIGNLEMTLKRKYLQKRLKGNLNVAVQNLDLVRLRRAINEVSAAGFLIELGIDVDQAQGLLSKLERLELIKKAVLDLTNSHIAEIKSYTAPPVQVHKVLMSILIVLGEDPEVVRDWFEIQVILVKTGKLSLKRRVQEYNHANLSTGNARRAANIISDINSEELHSISRAARVFYLWTSAVVEDRLSLDVIQ